MPALRRPSNQKTLLASCYQNGWAVDLDGAELPVGLRHGCVNVISPGLAIEDLNRVQGLVVGTTCPSHNNHDLFTILIDENRWRNISPAALQTGGLLFFIQKCIKLSQNNSMDQKIFWVQSTNYDFSNLWLEIKENGP